MTEEQRQAIEITAHYLMENPDDVIFSDYDYGIGHQQAAEELFRLAGNDVADYRFSCSISPEITKLALSKLRDKFWASRCRIDEQLFSDDTTSKTKIGETVSIRRPERFTVSIQHED